MGRLTGRTEIGAQNRSEVPGGPNVQEVHPEHDRYEVQGQPHAHELMTRGMRFMGRLSIRLRYQRRVRL